MQDQAAADAALRQGLSAVFAGPFATYLDKVAVGGHPDAIAGPDLLAPERLDRMLAAYGRQHGTEDARALTTMLCKAYVDMLMPVAMVASLVLGRDLPVRLEELRFTLDPEDRPARMILAHAGTPRAASGDPGGDPGGDPFDRFEAMVRGNLDIVIPALAAHGGISVRALWGNAASHYEWIVQILHSRQAIPDAVAGACERLVEARGEYPIADALSAGERNHHQLHWRRVCCLRYFIPALAQAYCSNCPIARPR